MGNKLNGLIIGSLIVSGLAASQNESVQTAAARIFSGQSGLPEEAQPTYTPQQLERLRLLEEWRNRPATATPEPVPTPIPGSQYYNMSEWGKGIGNGWDTPIFRAFAELHNLQMRSFGDAYFSKLIEARKRIGYSDDNWFLRPVTVSNSNGEVVTAVQALYLSPYDLPVPVSSAPNQTVPRLRLTSLGIYSENGIAYGVGYNNTAVPETRDDQLQGWIALDQLYRGYSPTEFAAEKSLPVGELWGNEVHLREGFMSTYNWPREFSLQELQDRGINLDGVGGPNYTLD